MQKILGNRSKGLLFIVSAPAGTGKTTLVQRLLSEFPSIARTITATTRTPRPGERDGIDYFFLSKDAFTKKVEIGEMLEHVTLYETLYGSLYDDVITKQNEGKHVILVIDTQGARNVRKRLPVISIMIVPPSLEILQQRLQHRQTETSEKQKERWEWAKKELTCQGEYDYVVLNDDLDVAYDILRSIFIAEACKTTTQQEKSL